MNWESSSENENPFIAIWKSVLRKLRSLWSSQWLSNNYIVEFWTWLHYCICLFSLAHLYMYVKDIYALFIIWLSNKM